MRAAISRQIDDIVARLKPILRAELGGVAPVVQGGVLIDLLAIWLAGHCVPGDIAATRRLRADLLASALLGIDHMVAINAKALGTPHDPIDPEAFRRASEGLRRPAGRA